MSEDRPHRVAIVGAGIGAAHLGGYLTLPGRFEVAAICDLDADRARAQADRVPGCRVETVLEQVLADPGIDLVDICLPPWLHAGTALQALAAGKHVVCEKPLAGSLREADAIAAAAAKAGRLVVPVFQYRYGPGIDALRHLVDAGLAGKPFGATLETHWNRDEDYYQVTWRGTWDRELGGAVVSHAIHAHDLLCQVLGPVARVNAFANTRVNPIETEDNVSAGLEMQSGALVTSSITLGAADNRSRMKFFFETLTAESGLAPYDPGGAGWRFLARSPMEQEAVDSALLDVPAGPPLFAGFCAALDRQLRGAPNAGVTLADGRRSLELATAVYTAARTGRTVALPLGPDNPFYDGWQPG